MSDEDAIIARATRAAQILAEPLVIETFAGLEAEYVRQWRYGSPKPPPAAKGEVEVSQEQREAMWLLLQNLAAFRGSFEAYIRHGQHALVQREQRDKAKRQDAEQ